MPSFARAETKFNYSAAIWEPVRDFGGVSSFRWRHPDSRVFAYRSIGATYGDVSKVMQVILDIDRRSEWIPELIENFVIEERSPTERIEYMSLRAPAPLKDRDLVFLSQIEVDPVNHQPTIRFTSLNDRDRESEQFVRGHILDMSFTLIAREPGVTLIEARAALDPRGAIPLEVADLVTRNGPINAILGIRRLLAKTQLR